MQSKHELNYIWQPMQPKYGNGTEWLDLEQSKMSSGPVKGARPVRKSLRTAAATKAKKMEEFVYTTRSLRGRRRKKY